MSKHRNKKIQERKKKPLTCGHGRRNISTYGTHCSKCGKDNYKRH